MFRILHDTKYDFIKYWKHAAALTIAFIVLGIGLMFFHRARTGTMVNESIEFTGGTLMQVQFRQAPNVSQLRGLVDKAGYPNTEITQFGRPTEFTIRAQPHAGAVGTSDSTSAQIERALHATYGDTSQVKVLRSEYVGPRVGEELRRNAFVALLISFIVTLIYLAIRFEWRFGLAAVVATFHDLLTTLAFLAMLRLEVSLTVIAALLTVVGYSLNDTIIIFDRVRENLKKQRRESLYDVMNRSINETLPRSVLTHATTLAATLALLFFAGEVIRPFSWIMAFGIFTGTFSSIYVASALLLWIERKWPRKEDTKGTTRALAEDRKRERSGSGTGSGSALAGR